MSKWNTQTTRDKIWEKIVSFLIIFGPLIIVQLITIWFAGLVSGLSFVNPQDANAIKTLMIIVLEVIFALPLTLAWLWILFIANE